MAPQIELPGIPETADESEILREQLEYLIEHTAEEMQCGCSECQRYLRVRSILLEIFGEPQAGNIREMASALAKAA